MQAQKYSIGTNIVDYLNLGTINAEAGVSVSRHFTANANFRFNNFTFNGADPSRQFQNRQQTYAVGGRYWMWHVYSGTWTGVKVQYREYNSGGILEKKTEEGDALGISFNIGYTYMLRENLNLDFSIGLWGGKKKYTVYECPKCGRIIQSGKKYFLEPNDFAISLLYIF